MSPAALGQEGAADPQSAGQEGQVPPVPLPSSGAPDSEGALSSLKSETSGPAPQVCTSDGMQGLDLGCLDVRPRCV
jgi:hypothetical protein